MFEKNANSFVTQSSVVTQSSIVSASELGEYVYCKRAWWLKVNGFAKENSFMLEGARSHNTLFNQLEFVTFKKIVATIFLITGLAGIIFLAFYK